MSGKFVEFSPLIVTNPGEGGNLLNNIAKVPGRLDIKVKIAGVFHWKTPKAINEKEWDSMLVRNAKGPFTGVKHLEMHLRRQETRQS